MITAPGFLVQKQSASTPIRRHGRRGFSLIEMLVVVAIIGVFAATLSPVIGAMFREMRFSSCMARIRAGFLQTHLIAVDHMRSPIPSITDATKVNPFYGAALVFRWAPAKASYDIFYAVHNAAAIDDTNAHNTLLSQKKIGYSRMDLLEPITLSTGIMVAGVRANASKPNQLELVSNSFAVCIDATQTALPPDQKIYANIQEATTDGGSGAPSIFWNTNDYNAFFYNELDGKQIGGDTKTCGEGFLTSLPIVILYRDDDLPHDEAGANVYRNKDGSLNTSLDPDELLRVTKGRLEMLTIQGGNTLEF